MRSILIFTLLFSLSSFAKNNTRYEQVVEKLEILQSQNPELISLFSIGKNDQNNDIFAVRIEAPFTKLTKSKSRQLVVGTHHGNEQGAADLAMYFINDIVKTFNNPKSPYYQDLKDSEFYIIPVLNISGYNNKDRRELDAAGINHDPNRDYPDACTPNEYFKLKSIQNLASFIDDINFVGAMTIHGYVGTLTFPWGFHTQDTHTNNHQDYLDITSFAVQANGYKFGTHADLIYPAVGTFEDWTYLTYGIWTTLLEVRRGLDLAQDSEAIHRYFAAIPKVRSKNHSHTGTCSPHNEAMNTMMFTPMGRP